MTISHLLGAGGLAAIVAFIVFAFRQGQKVKPDGRPDNGPSIGWPGNDHSGSGFDGGHGLG
jgi:hypothetical protein